MRHRAGVFGELQPAHGTDIIDTVYRTGTQVRAKLLVAKHSQPFFQAELEPVATGYAVTGPVVEIFMTNHPFDIKIVFVGCGIGPGEHIFGVKDIEAFILHRAHIKEVHGDNHIDVEVIFEAKTGLVPFHGVLERGHCPRRAVKVATVNEEFQCNFTRGAGCKGIAQHIKITRDQRKQVTRFRERILPLHPVTAIVQLALVHARAGRDKQLCRR